MYAVPREAQDLLRCWLDHYSRLGEKGVNRMAVEGTLDLLGAALRLWGVEPRDYLPQADEPYPLLFTTAERYIAV
jgi:hypothetical protein